MHGKDEKCIHSENLKVRDHSGDLGIERRIILERILREMWCEDVDWIHLAQDRDQWLVLVNTVMSLLFA